MTNRDKECIDLAASRGWTIAETGRSGKHRIYRATHESGAVTRCETWGIPATMRLIQVESLARRLAPFTAA